MADKKTIVYLKMSPLVLRLDEMIADAFGIKTAKLVAEIPLARGRNEVDPVVWARWVEQNKDSPLIRDGFIQEEKAGEKHDGEDDTFPGP
jgi:hypothetical protein